MKIKIDMFFHQDYQNFNQKQSIDYIFSVAKFGFVSAYQKKIPVFSTSGNVKITYKNMNNSAGKLLKIKTDVFPYHKK